MNGSSENPPWPAALRALARPDIARLAPYRHAPWEPGYERLHANENPWRNPADTSIAGLNRYPEPHPLVLESRLAQLYGVPAACLIAGRGSDEAIDLLLRVFCRAGQDAIVHCPPTFGMYAVAAAVQGAALVEVPLQREHGYALDVAGVIAAATATEGPQVKLVFLCAPNNPTGNDLPLTDLEAVLRALAGHALVVVDEAYVEFSGRDSLAGRWAEFPNLVVLRTLSKAYALAGVRCGVALGHPELIELLRRVIPPYAIPEPCIEAVLAALAPASFAATTRRCTELLSERPQLAAALAASPYIRRVWPSAANFLLVDCTDAGAVMARARAANLLLRDFSTNSRTPNAVRISLGTRAQHAHLLAALDCPALPEMP